MRILVIDDEKNIRRAMAMAIESMEHEVVCAASGVEAFKELKSTTFDAVFLDLKLQRESGLDVLGEILLARTAHTDLNSVFPGHAVVPVGAIRAG